MIDQSNRAGKFTVNGSDPRTDVSSSSSSSFTSMKQHKRLNKSRELTSNDRNTYHRTSPVSAPAIYQQLSPLYIPKGKSVHRSNISFELMLSLLTTFDFHLSHSLNFFSFPAHTQKGRTLTYASVCM